MKKEKKTRLLLIPVNVSLEVAKVFEFGCIKYKEDSWKKMVIKNPSDYYNAAIRHLYASYSGELYDKESKLFHLSHAIVNLIFLLWRELWKIKK